MAGDLRMIPTAMALTINEPRSFMGAPIRPLPPPRRPMHDPQLDRPDVIEKDILHHLWMLNDSQLERLVSFLVRKGHEFGRESFCGAVRSGFEDMKSQIAKMPMKNLEAGTLVRFEKSVIDGLGNLVVSRGTIASVLRTDMPEEYYAIKLPWGDTVGIGEDYICEVK